MPVTVQTVSRPEEAAQILSSNRNARFFGGGTILMRAVNEGDQSFDVLVRLTDPQMRQVRDEGGRIVVGAGVTMAGILANTDLAFLAPAARAVGGPAVRAAATVGGNLFAGPPYGDFTAALLALNATIEFAGTTGSSVSIDDFLRDRDRNRDRLVRSVSVPRFTDPSAFRFLKVSRVKPKGISVMSLAAYVPRSSNPSDPVRIAFGNMGPVPLRALAAERVLTGAGLSEAKIEEAIAVALDGLDPPTDALASTWYRRAVAPVHLKRLLTDRSG